MVCFQYLNKPVQTRQRLRYGDKLVRNFVANKAPQKQAQVLELYHHAQQRLNQGLKQHHRLRQQNKRLTMGLKQSLTDQRRAENRTKIQLGGLIIKAGLTAQIGLKMGDDLQLDERARVKATIILGALIEAYERAQDDDTLVELWRIRGEQMFMRDYITDKEQR